MDEKLGKNRRLRKRNDILRVLRKGSKIENENFKLVYYERKKDSRIAVSVKRKIVNSVKRNRIRRVLKEVFRKERENFKRKIDLMIIVKKDISEQKYKKTRETLRKLLKTRDI